jgi:hypothetical protein
MGIRSWARKFWILPRLTRYTCCAFFKILSLCICHSWATTLVFLILVVIRSRRAKLQIFFLGPGFAFLCSVCTVSFG